MIKEDIAEKIIEEFEKLSPEMGKWRVDRHVAKDFLLQALTSQKEELKKRIDRKIAIHKELEKQFVGSIADIKLGIKTHNSHSFVIKNLEDLLSELNHQ